MKVKEQFPTRAAADKKAAELRKKYRSVVVFPIGGKFGNRNHSGPWGVAYNPTVPSGKTAKAGKK